MARTTEHWWNDTDRRRPISRTEPVPVPHCPPQISHGLAQGRSWLPGEIPVTNGQSSGVAATKEENNLSNFISHVLFPKEHCFMKNPRFRLFSLLVRAAGDDNGALVA
jgi:hypothetical protein